MFSINKIFKRNLIIIYLILLFIIGVPFIRSFFTSSLYLPKPRGYVRIDLPKHEYRKLDKNYPYTFEYSKYAEIIPTKSSRPQDTYYIGINYPNFNATIHITHKFFKGDKKLLRAYWSEANRVIAQHQNKASEIKEKIIINKNKIKVVFIEIFGEHIASQCQFYTTDYKNNFLMGSLYFNLVPEQDYLKPMINFIKKDILHIIKTLNWKI